MKDVNILLSFMSPKYDYPNIADKGKWMCQWSEFFLNGKLVLYLKVSGLGSMSHQTSTFDQKKVAIFSSVFILVIEKAFPGMELGWEKGKGKDFESHWLKLDLTLYLENQIWVAQ